MSNTISIRYTHNMDSIYIHDLRVETRIGMTEAERAKPQTLRVSVELFTNTRKAGVSDNIGDTIDYARVAESVIALGKQERKTLEKFAEDAAELIVRDFHPNSVKVSVWKDGILPHASSVAVTIERP